MGVFKMLFGNIGKHTRDEIEDSLNNGEKMVSSDGTFAHRIGLSIINSEGRISQKIGNITFHSDGHTSMKIGNNIFDN
jgi:hypothetical protein